MGLQVQAQVLCGVRLTESAWWWLPDAMHSCLMLALRADRTLAVILIESCGTAARQMCYHRHCIHSQYDIMPSLQILQPIPASCFLSLLH